VILWKTGRNKNEIVRKDQRISCVFSQRSQDDGTKELNVPGGEHMADIKHGGVLAGPDVGGTDAEARVLDRHGPTSKGDHLAAVLDMVVVEDGLLKDLQQWSENKRLSAKQIKRSSAGQSLRSNRSGTGLWVFVYPRAIKIMAVREKIPRMLLVVGLPGLVGSNPAFLASSGSSILFPVASISGLPLLSRLV